jgi:N-acetyl-D-muramate 6-phosphate phosphatase
MRPAALLFDLDGTLVDSAPDLAGAANELRAERGLPPLPLADYRPHGGSGARGMLRAGFGLAPGDEGYEPLRLAFLERYAARLLHETALFDEVASLLAALAAAGLPLGIVTNKALHLAAPLADALGLRPPVQVLIGGDSTPHTKPHPAPLLAAATALAVPPEACVYVGDDPRDMLAARAAGMRGWAAAWGYLGVERPVADWGADAVIESPRRLLNRLGMA